MDHNVISISVLDNQYNEFSRLYQSFKNEKYDTFRKSYLITCEDSRIKNMSTKINEKLLKMQTSYNNINKWLNNYIINVKGVENTISKKSNRTFTESELAFYGAKNFDELKQTKLELSELLAPSLIGIVNLPMTTLGSKGSSQTGSKTNGSVTGVPTASSEFDFNANFMSAFTFPDFSFLDLNNMFQDFDFSIDTTSFDEILSLVMQDSNFFTNANFGSFNFAMANINSSNYGSISSLNMGNIGDLIHSTVGINSLGIAGIISLIINSNNLSISSVLGSLSNSSFQEISSGIGSISNSSIESISKIQFHQIDSSAIHSIYNRGMQNIGALTNSKISLAGFQGIDSLPLSSISLDSVGNISIDSSSYSSSVNVSNSNSNSNNLPVTSQSGGVLSLLLSGALLFGFYKKQKKDEENEKEV